MRQQLNLRPVYLRSGSQVCGAGLIAVVDSVIAIHSNSGRYMIVESTSSREWKAHMNAPTLFICAAVAFKANGKMAETTPRAQVILGI